MTVDFAQFSDAGPRANNEDAVLAKTFDAGRIILAVADGLGGHFGGKEASRIAIDVIEQEANGLGLGSSLLHAHEEIRRAASENAKLKGMATTATAVSIEGTRLFGVHCGDTRCLVQRGNGIRKLTKEHTEAQRLFEAGKLTKDEFRQYPRRNILAQALGADNSPVIDRFDFELETNDKIIITSDGVHEKIKAREILEICLQARSAKEIVDIVKEIVESRSPDDNYSVVAAVVGEIYH